MQDLLSGRRLTFWQTARLLWHLPTLLRLLVSLLIDTQVAIAAKALFIGAIAFILSPLDVPNFVPVLGQASDVVLALLACRWFLNSCPAELVAAHLAAVRGRAEARVESDPAVKLISTGR